MIHGLSFDNLRGDLYGGVTAAVVARALRHALTLIAPGAGKPTA